MPKERLTFEVIRECCKATGLKVAPGHWIHGGGGCGCPMAVYYAAKNKLTSKTIDPRRVEWPTVMSNFCDDVFGSSYVAGFVIGFDSLAGDPLRSFFGRYADGFQDGRVARNKLIPTARQSR